MIAEITFNWNGTTRYVFVSAVDVELWVWRFIERGVVDLEVRKRGER